MALRLLNVHYVRGGVDMEKHGLERHVRLLFLEGRGRAEAVIVSLCATSSSIQSRAEPRRLVKHQFVCTRMILRLEIVVGSFYGTARMWLSGY